jgi:hypothetical protein
MRPADSKWQQNFPAELPHVRETGGKLIDVKPLTRFPQTIAFVTGNGRSVKKGRFLIDDRAKP